MTPAEVLRFYQYAAHADPRNDLTAGVSDHTALERLTVWVDLLKEVPFSEAHPILERIYSKPQQLRLQPGHVLEAWAEIKTEYSRLIRRTRALDNILKLNGVDGDPQVLKETLEARAQTLAKLPEHVKVSAKLVRSYPALEAKANQPPAVKTHRPIAQLLAGTLGKENNLG